MAINLVAFWARNFREGISNRAARVRTEADHAHWVKESKSWMTFVVGTEAHRLGMSDEERHQLADACAQNFAEVDAAVCIRLYSTEAVS